MNSIILNIFTIATLLFSVFSITSKNPVISILFLIATFVLASCYIIYIGINFLGISYIIVYVGAIAILFLFIIMMINIKLTEIIETGTQYTKTLPLGLLIVSFFIFIFFSIIPYIFNHLNFDYISGKKMSYVLSSSYLKPTVYFDSPETLITNLLQIDSISFSIYIYGAVLLIICSLILLLAMFSAIIISADFDSKKKPLNLNNN